MYITEREFILLVGIVALIATYLISEWEMAEVDEVEEQKPISVNTKREFHSETFDEMKRGEVYKW